MFQSKVLNLEKVLTLRSFSEESTPSHLWALLDIFFQKRAVNSTEKIFRFCRRVVVESDLSDVEKLFQCRLTSQ